MKEITLSKEFVRDSLQRDHEYARTHKLHEPDYALPSGIQKLSYVTFGLDTSLNHFRQLVHLQTGRHVPVESVWFNHLNLTWCARVAPLLEKGRETHEHK